MGILFKVIFNLLDILFHSRQEAIKEGLEGYRRWWCSWGCTQIVGRR